MTLTARAEKGSTQVEPDYDAAFGNELTLMQRFCLTPTALQLTQPDRNYLLVYYLNQDRQWAKDGPPSILISLDGSLIFFYVK